MAKKKDNATSASSASAPVDAATFALGPQDDGSVVVRIGDDFDLMIARKALEKQLKNKTAAEGTVGAIADGDDPFLDRAGQSLQRLIKLLATARAPQNQIADTPIGKEIARATTEATNAAVAGKELEPVDGMPGSRWAPHVPTPRPKVGDPIRHPAGAVVSIASNVEFDPSRQVFVVTGEGSGGQQFAVVAHQNGDAVEWRLAGEQYETPTVAPVQGSKAVANEQNAGSEPVSPVQAGEQSSEPVDALTDDAPTTADDDESGMQNDAAATTDDVDEEGNARTVAAPAKRAAKKKTAAPAKTAANPLQRDRNQRAVGLGARGKKGGRK